MNKKIEEKKNLKPLKKEQAKVKKDQTKTERPVAKDLNLKKKKKVKRNIVSGTAYVYSTFNNTIISI